MSSGRILAVESSCDETAVAVVEGGRRIVASVIASQVQLHSATGGIVPEVAARAHLRWMIPVLDEARTRAGIDDWSEVEAVAVTEGPGLAGSLLVGITMAKTLAWGVGLPLVPVNHLEGHIYAAWLLDADEEDKPPPQFPLVALVVSGGHTFIVEMEDHLSYRLLGQTVDDAAGEAFDKVGRLLGLSYPGGPAIMKAAAGATAHDRRFPRAWMGDSFDFSFSGLKTAARHEVAEALGLPQGSRELDGSRLSQDDVAELAWAFQESVVDVLSSKLLRAARELGAKSIILGGGVAANAVLRDRIDEGARGLGVPLVVPQAGPVHGQRSHDRRGRLSPPCRRRPWRPLARRATLAQAGRLTVAREGTELDPAHLGPEAVERYLRQHRLGARKSLSQNHLADGAVLERIIEVAQVTPGERVVEVGPGVGILTAQLLAAGARVTAVELDFRLAGHLRQRFVDEPGLTLVEDDFLDVEVAEVAAHPWALVANVPYHITSPILHHVLGADPRPTRFVMMVQKEVAERIAAPPGGMSYLSVFVQYHAHVEIAFVVPAAAFEPAPEVDSAILVGTTRERRLGEEDEDELWRLVQAGFRERRKMIHNVLARQLPGLDRERVDAGLAACDIEPDRRPQTLSVDEWMALRAALAPLP